MKNYQNFGFFAAVVFAVGMVGFNLSDGTISLSQADSGVSDRAGLVGHIELIHTDSDGVIKSYVQTDNSITNKGVNCLMVDVFGATNGATENNCVADPGTYNVIGLSDTATPSTAMDLNSNVTSNLIAAGDLTYAVADSSTITQVADGTTAGEVDGIVRIQEVFTCTTSCGSPVTVYGASLMNATDADYSLFAYKDFSGGSITLNNGDSLTVNWDITVNGGGAES